MQIGDRLYEHIRMLRRELHQCPEPAFEEVRTAALISEELSRLEITHQTGIGKTGIVARVDSQEKGGPVVALRADIDGLPVEEKTGLAYASRNPGYMRACGHDGHVAMLLGAAAMLKKEPPPGDVVLIFQPAEEGGGGAEHIIEAGALDGVGMIFAGHLDVKLRTGEIGIRRDVETAYTDALEITIRGKGGHAAHPHEAVDAVLVASLFVIQLQNIVSRSIDPSMPAVITMGSIHSGSAYNVISDEAVLQGTIRCTNESTRDLLINRIRKTAASLSALHDAVIEVEVYEGYPPIINHPDAYKVAREAAVQVIGEDRVVNLGPPSMGGEDFSYYLKKVPGCFVRFGARKAGTELLSPHSSHFDFDEDALRTGAAFLAESARMAIEHLSGRDRAG